MFGSIAGYGPSAAEIMVRWRRIATFSNSEEEGRGILWATFDFNCFYIVDFAVRFFPFVVKCSFLSLLVDFSVAVSVESLVQGRMIHLLVYALVKENVAAFFIAKRLSHSGHFKKWTPNLRGKSRKESEKEIFF